MARSDALVLQKMGGLRELARLFFPVLLMTCSTYIILCIEKFFLGHLSEQILGVAVTAVYSCQIFQGACVALVMMAQVLVGRLHGEGRLTDIGAGIWQFLWFSCLALFVIVPISLVYGAFYFGGTELEATGCQYFYALVAISFLFPLGAVLSCFYLGRGKTRLVLWATLGTQLVKLLTAYILIFGWGPFPSFGLMGGAISTFIAQGGFCLFLLWTFLRPDHIAAYHTHQWRFQPKLFWECIQPGLLRAANRVLAFSSWAMIARLLTSRGDEALSVMAAGGALFFFLPFLGDAICQAQTTAVSQMLGARHYTAFNKVFWSGSILVLLISLLIAIPLLVFPCETFHWLLPNSILSDAAIQKVFLGCWLCCVFLSLHFVPLSYCLAFKDLKFILFMGAFNWINGFLFMYWAMNIVQIESGQFWIILSGMHFTSWLIYLFRMKWLVSRIPQAAERQPLLG